MKKFYIRWISEIVLLTTAIVIILMFDIQFTAGFIMQAIFMLVMVIIAVFVFRHEEGLLANYLEGEDDLPTIDNRQDNIKNKNWARVDKILYVLKHILSARDIIEDLRVVTEWSGIQDLMGEEWFDNTKEVVKTLYTIVEWPEVQNLMEEEWFRSEAVLYQVFDEEQTGKDSAYLIPIERVLDID